MVKGIFVKVNKEVTTLQSVLTLVATGIWEKFGHQINGMGERRGKLWKMVKGSPFISKLKLQKILPVVQPGVGSLLIVAEPETPIQASAFIMGKALFFCLFVFTFASFHFYLYYDDHLIVVLCVCVCAES